VYYSIESMQSAPSTLREKIMKLLEESNSFLTVDEIKVLVGEELSTSEIYEHLRHIAKSIRRSSGSKKVLLMKPPTCRKCGYVFKDLSKRSPVYRYF